MMNCAGRNSSQTVEGWSIQGNFVQNTFLSVCFGVQERNNFKGGCAQILHGVYPQHTYDGIAITHIVQIANSLFLDYLDDKLKFTCQLSGKMKRIQGVWKQYHSYLGALLSRHCIMRLLFIQYYSLCTHSLKDLSLSCPSPSELSQITTKKYQSSVKF